MNVTVCQLHDFSFEQGRLFLNDWQQLSQHVRAQRSELLVLPEMPFYPWLFNDRHFNLEAWLAAVRAHDEWETRLFDMAPALVCATRPVDFGNERYHEGILWDGEHHVRGVHVKAHLADEDHAWETAWYTTPVAEFEPLAVDGSTTQDVSIGFLIGQELTLHEQAERYGLDGVQLLVAPCSTTTHHHDTDGQYAARGAQAFCLSSNRCGGAFSGGGWIIAPDGERLAATHDDEPFVTRDLDVQAVRKTPDARRMALLAPMQ